MKRNEKKHFSLFLLTLVCALALPACGERQLPEPEEGVLIYAALNPISDHLKKLVFSFNKNHEDVQIEIKDYSDEGGIERLRTELVLGQVPDIMEMHYYGKAGQKVAASMDTYYVVPGAYAEAEDEYWMPYQQMVQKGYLEDLWPYIESDPELGRDGVLQAPLAAAEIDGGLYILFQKVVIFTLTGRESVVGDRYSWTLDELLDVFSAMPEGSTIMRYNMTKQDVFFNLLRFSLDHFVDREAGACFFNGQEFRDLIGFLECFPDEVGHEDPPAAEEEIIRNIKDGRQLLEGMMIDWPREIGYADGLWQERAAFPGYPTADGSSGSFFYPVGDILAMSSTCRNKDVAWEYIRALIMPRLSKAEPLEPYTNIPVNLHDYDWLGWGEIKQYNDHVKKFPELMGELYSRPHFTYGPPVPLLESVTEEHVQRHEDLVNHTTRLYWPDDDLTDIVWEVLSTYFAGDLTLDQAVDRIQNRASLYVNESR